METWPYIQRRSPVTGAPTVDRLSAVASTRLRAMRIADELWEAAQAVAAEQGETVTDVIVRALRRYGKL